MQHHYESQPLLFKPRRTIHSATQTLNSETTFAEQIQATMTQRPYNYDHMHLKQRNTSKKPAITGEQSLRNVQALHLESAYEPATQRLPSGCIIRFTNAGPC